MNTIGFILISTETGFEEKIVKKLLSIKEVTDANLLSGMYDIVVKIESETAEKIRQLIILKIRKIDKIRSLVSLIGRDVPIHNS